MKVKEKDHVVTLENKNTKLSFDLTKGTYCATDKSSGKKVLSDAKLKINNWSSDDEGLNRTWGKRYISDMLGTGMALDILLEKKNYPTMKFTFRIYEDHGFINVSGGIINTLDSSLQVKEIYVVADANIYKGTKTFKDFAMIDGFSGGEPLEYGPRMYSPLTRSNALKSRNNILLTFTENNDRKTLVFGGLTYHDFEKFAFIEQPRKIELKKGPDGKNSLLCYLDVPSDSIDRNKNGESLILEKGKELQTWHYHEFRCSELANSAKSTGEIIVKAENIVPGKKYILGFSWWNGYWHGNHEDNHQSVFLEYPDQGKVKRIPLLKNQLLPRFDGVEKKDVEQVELYLPEETTKAGTFRIIVTKGQKPEQDKNVYLSEIWLRDGSAKPLIPETLTPVKDCIRPRVSYIANLFAKDPVGKKVDPGTTYLPDDNFYINFDTEDPFTALEDYGKRVASAQQIKLSMYDFPTVCLWYAEVSFFGRSNAENSTLGAVNEMKHIKNSGFLNYSRAAVRLVPDSYLPNNQQGWWDDEHWQLEDTDWNHRGVSHNGRYVKPYETSEKWGKAVTDLGGIPLTYFQTGFRSEDYAKQFPGHMLFNKTYAWKGEPVDTTGDIFTNWKNTWIRNGRVVWGYDYTDPGFLAHLTDVYRNLKKGNIKGLMFDYPASGWAKDGGMEDQYSTTAAAYRNIFKYANEGLGPGAYIHERNMQRGTDVSIGLVASMRTENDTDEMDSVTVTRCGLRWYKNRVLTNMDTDSKNIVRYQDNRDKVRSILTMAYVVSGRLLLANSFSEFSPTILRDITRTFPYHTQHKSARPVDAFVSPSPMVYDFEVDKTWHQVTFYNPDEKKGRLIGINMSGQPVDGALGLDKNKSYYVYDFWNDNYCGIIKGTERLEQRLRPGEARMLSVREQFDHPRIISTNRHIMQGYLDVTSTSWDPETKTLRGSSKIIGNDPYVITIAAEGFAPVGSSCGSSNTKSELTTLPDGLVRLILTTTKNLEENWSVIFR
ncbi:MAG TPA: hypothetical protein ENK25_02840 [Bacteroidetes bacterium]|nr:hypothetical protein [Bacteroidota bacterium]